VSVPNVVHYTIWHLDTGNMIGDFATEAAALAAVRDEIQANASPDALVLQRERAGNDPEFVAGRHIRQRGARSGFEARSPSAPRTRLFRRSAARRSTGF